MFRLLLCLALVIGCAFPCAAQEGSAYSDLGHPVTSGPGVIRIGSFLPNNCATTLNLWGAGPATLYFLNTCTGEFHVFSLGAVAQTEAASVSGHPQSQLAGDAVGGMGAAPMGVGSQRVTSAALASGAQVVAFLDSTILGTGIVAANSTILQTADQFPVGPSPQDVVAADFNGDGIADLAVSNLGDQGTNSGAGVMIFLGKGDGTFTEGATVNAGASPGALYAADFNGDGKADLAVVNAATNSIAVLLGIGDGTFQAPASFPVAEVPQSVVAADFNGDGRLDLAVASQGAAGQSGSVFILPGNGDGTFKPAIGYPVGIGTADYLAWIDVNGDGKLDLIVANPDSSGIALLLGNGDGSFQAPVEYVTGINPHYFALVPDRPGTPPVSRFWDRAHLDRASRAAPNFKGCISDLCFRSDSPGTTRYAWRPPCVR